MNGLAPRPRHGLSLCSGGAGLDMGLGLAEPGFHTRCYVEFDPHPRGVLVDAQEAGYLAPAPIFDDVTKFDARPFRGAFDALLAGYPCQPFSHAGQRRGEDDERHLWPDIERIIEELTPDDRDDPSGLRWVFLENVAGHVSLGAETVLRALWRLGFTPAVGLFTASEVGAPHKRERWFCVAYRESADGRTEQPAGQPAENGRAGPARGGRELADSSGRGRRTRGDASQPREGRHADSEGQPVANTDGRDARAEREQRSGQQRFQPESRGALENAGRAERRASDATGHDTDRIDAGRAQADGGAREPDGNLGDALFDRARTGAEPPVSQAAVGKGRRRKTKSGNAGQAVADTERPAGYQGRHGATGQLTAREGKADCVSAPRAALFPPGPSDEWLSTIERAGYLVPAVSAREIVEWAQRSEAAGIQWESEAQSMVCRMVDGLANRTRALKLLGNGVLPLAAAHAWRTLSAAHGLLPVDLETADRIGK